jgi:hypothetical protein
MLVFLGVKVDATMQNYISMHATVEIGATPGSAQRPEHQKPAPPNSELRRHNQLL